MKLNLDFTDYNAKTLLKDWWQTVLGHLKQVQSALNSNDDALLNEASERKTADTRLEQSISTERNARVSDTSSVRTAINNKARTATLVVAASDSGAKSKAAADYVCDGTSDQTEINNAITALPSGGGKVLLLEGTYNISGTITVGKAGVTIEGMGAGTVLKRKTTSDLIKINANNCALSYFCIDGADTTTSNSVGGISSDYGPMISHLTISEYGAAIRVNNGAVIIGCVLSTKSFVCVFAGTDCIIAHNRINGTDNPVQGIQVYGKTAVIGNYIDSTGIGIQTYNQYNKIADNFITGCTKSINVEGTYNDISDNFIFGTNYTNLGGNTNTFSNNRYQ